MTIRQTAYDTAAGRAINTKNAISKAIQESMVRDFIYYSTFNVTRERSIKPIFVTGEGSSELNIPFFSHPMLVKNHKGVEFLCSDVRPFVVGGENHWREVKTSSQTEFNFVKTRFLLNLAWLCGDEGQMKVNLSFAGIVFAVWLADTIKNRYALDPKDTAMLQILGHLYYQSQFYSEESFDEETKQKLAVHTINIFKLPSDLVFSVIDKVGRLDGLDTFVQAVKDVLENVRLKDLNAGMIYTVTSRAIFLTNGQEIMAASLEHIPTWIAVVHAATNERTYRNTQIAKIVEKYGKNGASKQFVDNVRLITANYLENSNDAAVEYIG